MFSVVGIVPVWGLVIAMPYTLDEFKWSAATLLMHYCLAAWLAMQFLYNFASSQWKDAGACGGSLRPTYEVTGQFEMVLEGCDQSQLEDRLKYAPNWCMHCKLWKPPRAHHCSFNQRCVLRMDHYCPFTGNCIGFRNHGHFILMYFFAFVGLAYVLGMCLFVIWMKFDFRRAWFEIVNTEQLLQGFSGMLIALIWQLIQSIGFPAAAQTVGSVIALVAVSLFGCTTFWMAATNQTTLELHFPMKEYVQIKPTVYCPLGPHFYNWGWKRNLIEILGPRWWLRLLIPTDAGGPLLYVALAPRPSPIGEQALLGRIQQVDTEGVKEEVKSVRDLGIDPGPDELVKPQNV